MRVVNTSILRLSASISSPAMMDDLEPERFVDDRRSSAQPVTGTSRVEWPDIEELRPALAAIERGTLWSRFI